MIFDKYIALIIESIERHASRILTSTKEDNKILQSEIGALSKELKDREALHEKILEIERENSLLEDSVEGIQEEFISVSEQLEKKEEEMTKAGDEWQKHINDIIKERDTLADTLAVEQEKRKALIEASKGMLATAEKEQIEQRSTIASLEHEVQSAKAVVKSLMERNTEAQAKQERLLQLVKEYDKATVNMLNAILERRSSIEERATWEATKEALKGWDKPEVKRKGRPKKQS